MLEQHIYNMQDILLNTQKKKKKLILILFLKKTFQNSTNCFTTATSE